MTEVDPVRVFREALPRWLRGQVHNTQALVANVTAAIGRQGWTVEKLIAECTRDLSGVDNAGGVVMFRLQQAADYPPPNQPGTTGLAKLPLCGDCDAGWIVDPDTLLPSRRCPCRKVAV